MFPKPIDLFNARPFSPHLSVRAGLNEIFSTNDVNYINPPLQVISNRQFIDILENHLSADSDRGQMPARVGTEESRGRFDLRNYR